MSDDEIDYMSEEFLTQCVGNNDIRPGVSIGYTNKRLIEVEKKRRRHIEKKQRKKMRPMKEIQEERLKEGLGSALDTKNKGFEMLQKMGFKPGMSLGKEAEKGTGMKEPVSVDLKTDRVGLGWQKLVAQKRELRQEILKQRLKKKEEITDPIKYRERLSKQHHLKEIEVDVRKSQKVCYNLDSNEGILEPHYFWFWPAYTQKGYEGEEEEEDRVGDEQEYKDCTQEESEEVEAESQDWQEPDIVGSESSLEDSEVFEPSDQLEILTTYLRDTYNYCIWCYTTFDGPPDMQDNCPGPTRADHDS